MNRGLWLVLAVVGGLSLYMGTQSDDELLAPSRQSNGRVGGKAAGKAVESPDGTTQADAARPKAGSPRAADKRVPAMEPWLAQALVQGVARWEVRGIGHSDAHGPSGDLSAWRSTQPPPPPPVAVVDAGPPPAPTAPPFPHAWVGRFNDEAPNATPSAAPDTAASGASAPASHTIARAVLVGPQSTWVVHAGDVIEGQWRVDRIQDRTMSLTYLPLKQQQTVVMR